MVLDLVDFPEPVLRSSTAKLRDFSLWAACLVLLLCLGDVSGDDGMEPFPLRGGLIVEPYTVLMAMSGVGAVE